MSVVEGTVEAPTRVMLGGFPTVSVTRRKFAMMMVADCLQARMERERWVPKLVFSSNGQGISLAGKDPNFQRTMEQASWIHADGQSVVIASQFTAAPLPERIATTDFFHDAAVAAADAGLTFFILGGNERQNLAATKAAQRMYPTLKIVGRRNGFFPREEDEAVCAEIRDLKPDVLWVGLGKPLQEHWCVRNRENLTGIGWVKTCGGLYAFLAGEAPRAPEWMQNLSLEWLYRTMHDPKRLLWRYLTTNPASLWRLLSQTRRDPLP